MARLPLTLAVTAALAGCAATHPGRAPVQQAPPIADSLQARGLPPVAIPPPGTCRVWEPGRALGRQMPPRGCLVSSGEVPVEAWLLYRPRHKHDVVELFERDPLTAGAVILVTRYDLSTGAFLSRQRRKSP